MITLIYGDDLEKIEDELIRLTSGKTTIRLDGSKIQLKNLEEELLGSSLFGDESTFLVENLFKNKKKKELLEFIFAHGKNLSIILVERVKLTKRDLAALKIDSLKEYLLPQFYFKFLDDLMPKNGKALSVTYNSLLKSMTSEQIFYSLIKRVRALIAVKTGATTHSEIVRFAPWQMGKLKQQANVWDEDGLVNFYHKLYETEKKMKTSSLPVTLEEYIDIMLITELN